ncbi:MAG: DNA-protecting protein DprA [Rhodoferax sp.]|jgi:predicted Rossmann fold nucleotide-binding protein DprA/Smf involved in DNA uptake|nr:DNA-protecting protein DprA [Rhodoferax sp.]MBP9058680.1 DNA-protecting protein DprA [Rhodoferax sp.]
MSLQALSPDTEIVLLLCGRFGGERQEPFQPLSAREYGDFAKWLNAHGLRPADMLSEAGREQLPNVHEAKLERKRLDFLLARGTALALALERWSRGGLWVISRGDPEYPKRLRHHLKNATPPLLYGAGDKNLLDTGGLAIIGSRDATEAALDFTREVASKCARESIGVVSGGARGVDSAAMQGATEAGGVTIGVLASDLLKSSLNRQNRLGLQEGRLVLISPFYPEAGFNAGNAMARNKYIYALADHALVIDSALGSGGTWEGAIEDLRQQWVPLYVRTPGNGAGNAALVDKGGIAFPVSMDSSEKLCDFFERTKSVEAPVAQRAAPLQQALLADVNVDEAGTLPEVSTDSKLEVAGDVDQDVTSAVAVTPELVNEPEIQPIAVSELQPTHVPEQAAVVVMDMYVDFVSKLSHGLANGPMAEDELATLLCIEKSQAKAWLKRAFDEGAIDKLKKPVRYALRVQAALC